MSEAAAEVAALETLEVSLRAALAALRGPAYWAVGRHVRPWLGCRVSVTSLEALAIHLGQVAAALAELRATLEQGTVPKIAALKRDRRRTE
jgi:hypothetical protein